MKRFTAIFAGLVFAVSLQAQTAKVIQLSPEDATKGAALYAQKSDIEKQIDVFDKKIYDSYLVDTHQLVKDGWFGGFEYSSDFKFIVPKNFPPTTTCPYWTTNVYTAYAGNCFNGITTGPIIVN